MKSATLNTHPEYVRSEPAADIIKKSPKWLEADRRTGPTIPYIKNGRNVLYRVDDLIAHLEARSVPAIVE